MLKLLLNFRNSSSIKWTHSDYEHFYIECPMNDKLAFIRTKVIFISSIIIFNDLFPKVHSKVIETKTSNGIENKFEMDWLGIKWNLKMIKWYLLHEFDYI